MPTRRRRPRPAPRPRRRAYNGERYYFADSPDGRAFTAAVLAYLLERARERATAGDETRRDGANQPAEVR